MTEAKAAYGPAAAVAMPNQPPILTISLCEPASPMPSSR
jgi:hypothetical protein